MEDLDNEKIVIQPGIDEYDRPVLTFCVLDEEDRNPVEMFRITPDDLRVALRSAGVVCGACGNL